jgi:hypothetical protein
LQLPVAGSSASCCFSSLLSFWLPWIYSPFPFFMEFRNDVLLQLVECIESSQNEVKRKMMKRDTRNAVPKSRAWVDRKKKFTNTILRWSSVVIR